MTPKIGDTVYCIYRDCILKHEVGYVGKCSFIVDDFTDDVFFDSLEWFYEDYGKHWFTNFNDAADKLLEWTRMCHNNAKIVAVDKDVWEVAYD